MSNIESRDYDDMASHYSWNWILTNEENIGKYIIFTKLIFNILTISNYSIYFQGA